MKSFVLVLLGPSWFTNLRPRDICNKRSDTLWPWTMLRRQTLASGISTALIWLCITVLSSFTFFFANYFPETDHIIPDSRPKYSITTGLNRFYTNLHGVRCEKLFSQNNWPELKAIKSSPKRSLYGNETLLDFIDNEIILGVEDTVKSTSRETEPSLIDGLFCARLKVRLGFITSPLTDGEKNNPIAFSIVVHDNFDQFFRLLRSIYRPQNVYCVHIDSKSRKEFFADMERIIRCFSNVFIASKLERVVYASISRLEADLNCMGDLLANAYYPWNYVLNVVGSDFPIRTNRELVEALSRLNGYNDVEGLYNRVIESRFKFKYVQQKPARNCLAPRGVNQYDCSSSFLARSNQPKSAPPHLLSIVRGSAFVSLTRPFVRYVLFESPEARDLLDWSRDSYSPDEHFWATMNFLQVNPHLQSPGGYRGVKEPWQRRWFSKYARWGGPCQGRIIRGICMFSTGDLPSLGRLAEFFLTKVLPSFDWPTYQCLEAELRRRVENPVSSSIFSFNASVYVQN